MINIGRDLDTPDIREPLHQINVDFPHEIGHMVAAYGAIVEGKIVFTATEEIEGFRSFPLKKRITCIIMSICQIKYI